MKTNIIRPNNFDIIRFVAAFQVVLHHSVEYLGIEHQSGLLKLIFQIVLYFPGVPAFFFISGFLISRSYENSKTLGQYTENRLLRIYPALIVCNIVSVIAVYATGYLPQPDVSGLKIAGWMLAQSSVVQFYNPDFMRGFGVGVLNGSLWTIAVELQFYVLTPILYRMLPKGAKARLYVLVAMTAAFCLINLGYWKLDPENQPSIALKLLGVSFMPWFYMFLCGVLAQQNFDRIKWLFQGRALTVSAVYFALVFVGRTYLDLPSSNDISPLLYVPLVWMLLSWAYTRPELSEKLLHGNDISYGLYIYHMPVINVLRYLGLNQGVAMIGLTAVIAIVLATCSWLILEKRCLSMKKGLRPVAKPALT